MHLCYGTVENILAMIFVIIIRKSDIFLQTDIQTDIQTDRVTCRTPKQSPHSGKGKAKWIYIAP